MGASISGYPSFGAEGSNSRHGRATRRRGSRHAGEQILKCTSSLPAQREHTRWIEWLKSSRNQKTLPPNRLIPQCTGGRSSRWPLPLTLVFHHHRQ